ncbi:hypothetical protein HDU87_006839 [Geranomyces variabilis]|uniref:FZ domain-containing protein n=1 Tax=Geranomyces variabilis TaxID=109894 RepID=A0AAD5XT38_9FUNG|nr:hypothetical protein HDU87_006839 [Geranomyces variabilis]
MWKPSLWIASTLLASGVSAQSNCTSYNIPDGVCASVLTYPVYAAAPVAVMEGVLEDRGLRVLQMLLAPFPDCYSAFLGWACTSAFPQCSATGVKLPCLSTCQAATAQCTDIFTRAGIASQLPDCSSTVPGTGLAYPADPTTCVAPVARNSTGLLPVTTINCPSPLVRNPNPLAPPNPRQACVGACCVACPRLSSLFPPDKITDYLRVTDAFRAVSAVLTAFILVSFTVLQKRSRATAILWWFVFSVMLFSTTVFLSLGRRKTVQCTSEVTESDQHTNTLCAVQGGALLFAAIACVLWCSALVFNLHATAVWNSHTFSKHLKYIHAAVWSVCAILTGLNLGFGNISYQFGGLCFLDVKWSSELFYYPLTPFVGLAFVIHVITVIYVGRIAVKASGNISTTASSNSNGANSEGMRGESTRRRVTKIWKTSWRSILLIAVFLSTFAWFFAFYFKYKDTLNAGNNPPFVQEWFKCVLGMNGSQAACSGIATPHLPSYSLLVTVDVLPSLLGVWLFVIFGIRGTLIAEWRTFFRKRRNRKLSIQLQRRPEGLETGGAARQSTIGWEIEDDGQQKQGGGGGAMSPDGTIARNVRWNDGSADKKAAYDNDHAAMRTHSVVQHYVPTHGRWTPDDDDSHTHVDNDSPPTDASFLRRNPGPPHTPTASSSPPMQLYGSATTTSSTTLTGGGGGGTSTTYSPTTFSYLSSPSPGAAGAGSRYEFPPAARTTSLSASSTARLQLQQQLQQHNAASPSAGYDDGYGFPAGHAQRQASVMRYPYEQDVGGPAIARAGDAGGGAGGGGAVGGGMEQQVQQPPPSFLRAPPRRTNPRGPTQ